MKISPCLNFLIANLTLVYYDRVGYKANSFAKIKHLFCTRVILLKIYP